MTILNGAVIYGASHRLCDWY